MRVRWLAVVVLSAVIAAASACSSNSEQAARKISGRARVQDSIPMIIVITPGRSWHQRRGTGELDGGLIIADQLVDRGRHRVEE